MSRRKMPWVDAYVSREEGVSEATIYNRRKAARERGLLLPVNATDSEGWRSRDKFNAVLECSALSEVELAEYCRRRGLYPEQLRRWRESGEGANARSGQGSRQDSEAIKSERKRNKALERELRRKDAALAETVALLTLRKKRGRSGTARKNDQCPRSPPTSTAINRILRLDFNKESGASGWDRTSNPCLRRAVLYPLSYGRR